MEYVKDIAQSDFEDEVIKSDKLVIVKFWATWCGPCKTLNPIMEEIAKENKDLKFVAINVDDSRELIAKYGIKGIPTILYIKDGQVKSIDVGGKSKSDIMKSIHNSMTSS